MRRGYEQFTCASGAEFSFSNKPGDRNIVVSCEFNPQTKHVVHGGDMERIMSHLRDGYGSDLTAVTEGTFRNHYRITTGSEALLERVTEQLLAAMMLANIVKLKEVDQLRARLELPNAVSLPTSSAEQNDFFARNKDWCDTHKDELLAAGITEEQFGALKAAPDMDALLDVYFSAGMYGGKEPRIVKEHKETAKEWLSAPQQALASSFINSNMQWCEDHKEELKRAGVTDIGFVRLTTAPTKEDILTAYYDMKAAGESLIAKKHKRLAKQWEQTQGAAIGR